MVGPGQGLGRGRGRAQAGRQLAPALEGLADGDVGDSGRPQGGGDEGADGAGPRDQHPPAGPGAAPVDAVEGHGQGLGQGGDAQGEAGRHPVEGLLALPDVAGEGSLPFGRAGQPPLGAERGTLGQAEAATAAVDGAAHDLVSRGPAGHLGPHLGDPARPLVTPDGARMAPAFDDHVEVAAAHAAVAHLDQDVVGTELGEGALLEGQRSGPAVHGGGHPGGEGGHGRRTGWTCARRGVNRGTVGVRGWSA